MVIVLDRLEDWVCLAAFLLCVFSSCLMFTLQDGVPVFLKLKCIFSDSSILVFSAALRNLFDSIDVKGYKSHVMLLSVLTEVISELSALKL